MTSREPRELGATEFSPITDSIKVPPTLLLADDSVTIQRVIELTFADEDVRVIAVSNGEEAIALLNRTPPDIVLADVGMPGPSGYDIAQHIKDTPRLAHIPVVLLTGAFEPINQAKAAAVGCDGRSGQTVRTAACHRTCQGAARQPEAPGRAAGGSLVCSSSAGVRPCSTVAAVRRCPGRGG